jgi:hypothetical protein
MLTTALNYVQYVTMVTPSPARVMWVLLAYRVPRVPSSPRIAIWRRLRKLGAAQVGDGLVALPADARTREALEWLADDAVAAGGTASVWQAELTSRSAEQGLIAAMAAARAEEYEALTAKVEALLDTRTLSEAEGTRRLRRELRSVQRRDFFPPPARQRCQAAFRTLAERLHQPTASGRRSDRTPRESEVASA